jgi:DNA-directed RNA polymerase alpha subunit
MTDQEYAARIYRQIFTDDENTPVRGMPDVLSALDDARTVIENLGKLVVLLSRGMFVSEELHAALDKLDLNVCDLGLSARTKNALLKAGRQTVQSIFEITTFADLFSIRNLGQKSRDEVISKMRGLGFNEWADMMTAGWARGLI